VLARVFLRARCCDRVLEVVRKPAVAVEAGAIERKHLLIYD